MNQKINIVTLGCSKNWVDSEVLFTQLKSQEVEVVHNANDTSAKTWIINTCGFIADAQEESVDIILGAIKAKKNGLIDNVFVFGCLSERFKDEIRLEIPEVDQYFGVDSLEEVLQTLKLDYKKELIGERKILTPSHYAYLKVSEGCSRKCAFCAIPLIRGKHKSKPIDELVKETQFLVKNGVKEIMLIAQDLSYYGFDLYKEHKLADLLNKLSAIEGLEWIRLHYLYPANFPLDVIDVIKSKPNICKYIDIPVQHISDNILKSMRRGHTKQQTKDLIDKLRNEIPEIAIRTSILVGYPGETDDDFEELKQFVKETKFERLGVFSYSPESGTYSGDELEDDVPEEIKAQRETEIMDLQNEISYDNNMRLVGTLQKVLIDSETNDYFLGRTQFDSPEVDNEVIIQKTNNIKTGEFYQVRITQSEEYDLYGKMEDN